MVAAVAKRESKSNQRRLRRLVINPAQSGILSRGHFDVTRPQRGQERKRHQEYKTKTEVKQSRQKRKPTSQAGRLGQQ